MSETLTPTATPTTRSYATRTVRNVISNWGAYIFSVGINFFLAPFVIGHLGNSAYGAWVLMVSLTGYLGLLDLGVRGAVTRYVAKFYTAGEHQESSRIVSSALMIFTLAGILAIIVSLGMTFLIVEHFDIPPKYSHSAQIVLVLTGISVAVSLVSGAFGGILVGLQRFELTNGIEILTAAARAVSIVLALSQNYGLVALACIQLAFSLARGLASAILSYRLYPQLRLRPSQAGRHYLSLIFSFSVYSFLIHVSGYLIFYTDTVVIGAFMPVHWVTFFAIAGNLIYYARNFISGISQTMTPLASSLEARGDMDELRGVLLKGSRFASLLVLPIVLTFMIRGKAFIGLWIGWEYRHLSGWVLWVLSLALMFSAGTQVAMSIMLGISQHKALVPVIVAEALCNLGISILLVRPFGIVGVAWGTTIPNLVTSLIFWPWYTKRVLGIPRLRYVLNTWVRPGLAMIPFALCTYAFRTWAPATNLFVLFAQIAVCLPVALLFAWYVCFERPERQAYAEKISNSWRRAFGKN